MNLDERLLRQAVSVRLALLTTFTLGLVGGILVCLQADALSEIVAQVFLNGAALYNVRNLLLLLAGLISLRAGVILGSEYSAHAVARQIKTSLRAQLIAHIPALGPAGIQEASSGELTSVIMEGIESLDAYYSQYLPQLALSALVPFTVLFFIFPIDWLSGVVLLLTAPLIPLFMVLIGNSAENLTRRQWQTLSRMNAYFLDVLHGLTTLKALGRSREQIRTIHQVSERYRQATMEVLRVTFLSSLALELVATLSTAIVAVQIGLRLLSGQLTFQESFFILLLAPEFYLPLRLLGMRFHAGMSGVVAARSIYAILERKPSEQPCRTTDQIQDQYLAPLPVQPFSSIRFQDVGIVIENRTILERVTFEIKQGQKVALIGPSGAGKTTIANLLLRFLEPKNGEIRVGNLDLQEIPPENWRESLAWISQKPFLFNTSIAENIRLGKPQASMEQIIQAARLAQADEFITKLPDGYSTGVGESGIRLSAGQAQRIAIARAFMKEADFLILDEATANLDPETEIKLQESIETLLTGRTALIIAHRLNTVINADQIILLDQGKVLDCGVHKELIERNPLYRRLFSAQYHQESSPDSHSEKTIQKPGCQPVNYSGETLPDKDKVGNSLPEVNVSPEGANDIQSPITKLPGVFLRLLSLVSPYKTQVALSVFLGFATIASAVGLMSTAAYLVSAAALQPSIAELQIAIVGVRAFGITRGLFRYLERYTTHQATFRILARLRVKFFEALEPLAPARLVDYHSGDLLARISGDIDSLENLYVRALAPPMVAIMVAVLACLLLNILAGAGTALILLGFLITAGICLPVASRGLSRQPGKRLVEQRAALSAACVEGIQGVPELLVFNQETRHQEKLQHLDQNLSQTQAQLAFIGSCQSAAVTWLAGLGMWSVLIMAIPLVNNGQLAGVYLATVTMIALTSFEAVLPLPHAAQALESNLAAAQRLFEVIDANPEISDPTAPLPAPQGHDIKIQNLGFTYPLSDKARYAQPSPADLRLTEERTIEFWTGSQQPDYPIAATEAVLQEISISLSHGKHIAIVGPSGSGKSTLLYLLLRFWDFHSGHVELDGQDIRRYQQDDVRRSFAFVGQNSYLFNTTIRQNLLLANPKATTEMLDQAVNAAHFAKTLSALPQSYETWIGEGGVRLSAGERQRLLIARIYLKATPILLLDEPGENLDAITGRGVLGTLGAVAGGRAILWVTHRLVGMEKMDEILVMQSGQIVGRGLHHELLAASGYYRRMWEIQYQILDNHYAE